MLSLSVELRNSNESNSVQKTSAFFNEQEEIELQPLQGRRVALQRTQKGIYDYLPKVLVNLIGEYAACSFFKRALGDINKIPVEFQEPTIHFTKHIGLLNLEDCCLTAEGVAEIDYHCSNLKRIVISENTKIDNRSVSEQSLRGNLPNLGKKIIIVMNKLIYHRPWDDSFSTQGPG